MVWQVGRQFFFSTVEDVKTTIIAPLWEKRRARRCHFWMVCICNSLSQSQWFDMDLFVCRMLLGHVAASRAACKLYRHVTWPKKGFRDHLQVIIPRYFVCVTLMLPPSRPVTLPHIISTSHIPMHTFISCQPCLLHFTPPHHLVSR